MLKHQARTILNYGSSLPWKWAFWSGLSGDEPWKVQFVIEEADWAIRRVGEYLEQKINLIEPQAINLTTKPNRANGKVLHFGSQYMWLTWARAVSKNNKIVTSFFHGNQRMARVLQGILIFF